MTIALHSCDPHAEDSRPALSGSAIAENQVWIDLVTPSPEEIAFVERVTGFKVPTRDEIGEIEASSRLRSENGALYFSTPVLFGAALGEPRATPLGLILSKDRLVTVRFEEITVFQNYKGQIGKPDCVHPSAPGAFVGLLEAIVDRYADHLERVGAKLDQASHMIFRDETGQGLGGMSLRETIRMIGREGDFTSKVRDSLLGIGRIVPYADTRGADWVPPEVHARFATLKQDILSLNDYDAYLTAKVQFLLDATLGLVNIDQNNIMKVLTVFTVAALGPTLVASWYGMNFKNIPEYDWSFGYPYALLLALATGIGPLIWFRLRRWL
ncbi:MAG TPA: magnesium transporter CorA family protein [Alphaproteobacteria bacterium]|nr:magnesium transporter CorA family protein [Alphaproteobacteria bacterium]